MRIPSPYNRLILPVYIPTLLISTSQIALLVMLPLHVVDLGYSPALAATVVGVRGLGLLLFDVPAGLIVARLGDKPALLIGLGLAIAGTLLLAIDTSVAGIVVASLLIGAGFSSWMLGRQSYIADTCESHEIGRAIAAMAGLQRVGIFIGPAAGGVLAAGYGFGATFTAGAILVALAGGFVLAFTRNYTHDRAPEHISLRGMAALFRSHGRIFATAGTAALVLQLMRAARQLLVPLIGQAAGLDTVAIGTIYSLSAGIDMSLFYPVGVVVDRWGRKWSAVPSMALFAVGLALLPAAQGYWSLLSVGMVLGLANGLGTGIVMIIGADLAQRTDQRGQFLGLWRLCGDAGMASAPLLTGALVAVASLTFASAAVATAGFAGAVIALLFVPETLRRQPAPARDSQ